MTVEQVRERVREGGLLAGGERVVAMLSGGRDSVCLLDVAVTLCGAERVRALHVNYGLRPEADGDERHCRELCGHLGVPIEVVAVDPRTRARGNLHAWARELRYRAAIELAERLDRLDGETPAPHRRGSGDDVRAAEASPPSAVVATGHTATDQVETILYRLAASPGRRALLGMAPREGRVVRPLLGIAREQTAAHCRERGLSWREDASNDDERYARARVRHGLAQALAGVHPAAEANVLRTAELLREETELLDALVDAELGGRESIAIEGLAGLPAALQRLVAIRLAERAAGTFVPQAGERVQEILQLASGGTGRVGGGARGGLGSQSMGRVDRGARRELHIGGLVAAVVQDGVLRMVKIPPRKQHGEAEQHGGPEQHGGRERRGGPERRGGQ